MNTLLLTLVSLVVGVLVTVAVSRHFFRKSVAKRLTPYIQHALPLLSGIDPEVRNALKVFYHDTEVDDLFQLQFIIVNDGERAIRDCIEPLSLPLPIDVQVLDATVLHVHPSGRSVEAVVDETENGARVRFPFQLLNKGEGFVAKILIKGSIDRKKLRFEIVVDDLPPVIEPRVWQLAFRPEPERFDAGLLGAGLVLLIFGSAGLGAMLLLRAARPALFPLPWAQFEPTWAATPVLVVWGLSVVLLLLLAVLAIAGSIIGSFSKQNPPFPVPSHLRRRGAWAHARPEFQDTLMLVELEEGKRRERSAPSN